MFDWIKESDAGCGWIILGVILILGLVFGLMCLEAWMVMALWNGCLVPAVTFANQVGFWQTWGIMLICNVLFKNTYSSSKKN